MKTQLINSLIRNIDSRLSVAKCTLAGLTISLCSCHSVPDGVLSEDEMTELLTEMTLAESYRNVEGNVPDSIRNQLGEGILASHGYTYEQLDSSLNWYGRHLDKYYKIYDRVDRELYKRQRKLAKKSGDVKGSGDISGENLWPYADHFWLSPLSDSDGLNFDITGASLLKGESLEWKLRLNKEGNIKIILGAEYSDGTVTYANTGSYGQKRLKLQLLTDTSKQVKRIIGIIHADKNSLPLWADSVQLTKLPYDSAGYYRLHTQRTYRK
ncbi:MAG: DUF4296 domain-containing protein [Clostridium sp.]|nr:DUF4296 domain-containing protein [Prevotella sp.]MCM1429297.1 DUF4296 domain-containing protein [Clostridium sp.]MCM1475670.1 DUF4296 domain-containing protein [Muribaculaceae bacterium]